ncbi:MAG: YgjV family protein [Clostridia bacterium]|nr:YgjV family protein [Clostridia bacterium]
MQTLSFILSILGLICIIVSTLVKGKSMKLILFLVSCGNALVATSYLIGGSGINGAASCYIGAVQAIINYFFESKNKPLPKWLVAVYALSFIVVNLAVGGVTGLSILAIVATLMFIMCIGQKSGAKYRFWTILNNSLWCLYDILSKSYGALTSHIPLLIFTVVGMIIHDRKKKGGEVKENA